MFCTKCGSKLKTDGKFCVNCGTDSEKARNQVYTGNFSSDKTLKQMSEKMSSFLFVRGALVLNFLLMLSPVLTVAFMSDALTRKSHIGFSLHMREKINAYGRFASMFSNDMNRLNLLLVLAIIGIILFVFAIIMIFLPMARSKGKASLIFAKTAALYNLALYILVIIVVADYPPSRRIGTHFSFIGVIYILETIVLVAAAFLMLSKLKKKRH